MHSLSPKKEGLPKTQPAPTEAGHNPHMFSGSCRTANGSNDQDAPNVLGSDVKELHDPPTSSVFLCGFQGSVRFHRTDRLSFVDAVVRLMGPTRSINVAIYRGPDAKGHMSVDVLIHDVVNDSRVDPYCFDHVQFHLERGVRAEAERLQRAGDGAVAQRYIPFVYAPGEELPTFFAPPDPSRRQMGWEDTRLPCGSPHVRLVKCIRQGDTENPDADEVDVAYVALPASRASGTAAKSSEPRLASNQYGRAMMLVARILTPGAGRAIVDKGDAGLVAHSRIGWGAGEDGLRFSTHGGLGYPQAAWDDLVARSRETGVVGVHVELIDEQCIGVHLAGYSHSRRTRADDESDDDDDDKAPPTSVRAGLARCIDRIVSATTSAEEQARLVGVDIWPDGQFWNRALWPVRGRVLPCTVASLQRIDDQPDLPSSVIAIRPVYQSYTAWVPEKNAADGAWRAVPFELDEEVDAFLDGVREAAEQPACGAVRIRHGNPTVAAAAQNAYRPEFLVTAATTQDEWLAICSQIVGPDLAVLPDSDAVTRWTPSGDGPWGAREESYHNFEPMRFHQDAYAAVVQAREAARGDAVVEEDDDVAGEVEIIEIDEDAGSFSPLGVCTLCDHTFATHATVTDKLRHMVDAHGVLGRQLRAARPGVPVDRPAADAVAPEPTPGRHGQNSYGWRPSADSSGNDEADGGGGGAAKRRKAHRARAHDDPTYRPEDDGSDDEQDHDLGSAKLLPEERGTDETRKRKRAGGKKRVDDPTYRPDENDEGEEDEEEEEEEEAGSTEKRRAAKKAKRGGGGGGRLDQSYRPSPQVDKAAMTMVDEDADEHDEELRRSAVPEWWARDPTDPAGKRMRVIREARHPGGVARNPGGARREASQATAAVLQGQGKATGKGKAASSTPRRGRSRRGTPCEDR